MDEQICENCGFERELNRGLCEGCEAERIATAPLLATIAALESRLAEVERELDRVRVDLVTAQHAIGEGWFAGGVDTATAIERKTKALEDGARDARARAAAAEERAQEAELRAAALESRLAEAERERDAYREKASHLPGLTAELDALRYHYDAAAPEHNLPALLDLYLDRQRQAESERDIALARAHRIEAAAREAADLLGVVASEVEGDAASVYGQVRWARDARRLEASIRAALEGGGDA